MKKYLNKKGVVILICSLLLMSVLVFNLNNSAYHINTINKIDYNQLLEKLRNKDSFVVCIGRSDCIDCQLFNEEYGHNIEISSSKNIYYLDVKEYRDEDEQVANKNNNTTYKKIKKFFTLKWVPTIYVIYNGDIVSNFEYLDTEYHSLDENDKQVYLEKCNKKLEKFINDGIEITNK